MKKGLLLMILVFTVGMTYGQSRTQLQGPKAKNYKPWKNPSTAAVASSNVERVQWSNGKKARIWRNESQVRENSKLATTNRARLRASKGVPFTGWIRSSSKYSLISL
ncbi:MAG: hypothetical protein HKN87_09170 [Saprospiraceae bacterium]|nr:hypothetical protein [Saprospiraceae bacterium]